MTPKLSIRPVLLMALGFAATIGSVTACGDDGRPVGSAAGMGGSGAVCQDVDDDQHGVACAAGPDCNDLDPSVFENCPPCTTAGRQGCVCDAAAEGTRVPCGKVTVVINGIESCGYGESLCSDGQWGECIINNTLPPPESQSFHAQGLGSPASCVGNPCDPYCMQFDDDSDGLDPGDGGSVVGSDGITNPRAACAAPNPDVCQRFGSCGHDVCNTGGALSVGCDIGTSTAWVPVFRDTLEDWSNWGSIGWDIGAAQPSACSTLGGAEDPITDHTPGPSNSIAGARLGSCISVFDFVYLNQFYLRGPLLDLSGYSDARLRFFQQLMSTYPFVNQVRILDSHADPIATVYTAPSPANIDTWQEVNIDLGAYVGQQIRFEFEIHAARLDAADLGIFAPSWSIDDVTLEVVDPTPSSYPALGSCIQDICSERPSCCSGSWDQGCVDLVGCHCLVQDPNLESCANESAEAELAPIDLYVMLDRSCSMDDYGRWDAVTTALTSFVNDTSSDGVGVGIEYFPYDDTDSACTRSNYAAPSVNIAPLPANASALALSIANTGPYGWNTPTLPAVRGAVDHARAHQQSSGRRTAVVLATDGEPNGCSSDVASVTSAISAGLSSAEAINTFVIGVGSSAGISNMNAWAAAGGTTQAYVVNNSDVAGFISALNNIRATGFSCSFQIPTPSSGVIDPAQVNVVFHSSGQPDRVITRVTDASGCDASGGWYFDDNVAPTQVVLCPATCTQAEGDASAGVELVFGCQSQTLDGSPGYNPSTFDRTYDATQACGASSGLKPVWGLWSWASTTPSDSRVRFQIATGNTQSELDSASFAPLEFTADSGTSGTPGTPAVASFALGTENGSLSVASNLTRLGLASGVPWVRVRMLLDPSTDGQSAPNVSAWNLQLSCIPSE
ncbi:MAG: vWA domain-containing protein [Polyangiaceae bacterium]